MPDPARWALACLAAYLAGSIPFGVLIGKAHGIDIRLHGSKNVGATNVGRVLGRTWGLLCFVLDLAKGALPVALLGAWLGALGDRAPDPGRAWLWMALAGSAVLGHMASPFLGFRGGKGVATGLGALLALWPQTTLPALAAFALWILSARLTRYVGVSSCLAAAALPALVAASRAVGLAGDPESTPLQRVRDGWPFIAATAALAALTIWKHRGNIRRTLAGTEPRIGQRTLPKSPPPPA